MWAAAASGGTEALTEARATFSRRPERGTGFANTPSMANSVAPLQTAAPKHNRNLKVAEDKTAQKRPPIKKLPPPDEDVLVFLPIG